MFSGIIEELGKVRRIARRGSCRLIEVAADKVLEGVKTGDSIAINGACLTAVNVTKDILAFEVMPETLKDTNLGLLKVAEKVNLERSLRIGERLSGHFVTGHVDCLGLIRKKHYFRGNLALEICIPAKFGCYLLPKGAVAVDGVSLTVMHKTASSFSVYIIPHTLKNTTLGFKGQGQKVNVEFDILAKKGSAALF